MVKSPLLWLVLLCVLPRVAVLLIQHENLRSDPDGYRQVARNLIEWRVLGIGSEPTAIRPPLYPLLVALCEWMDPGGLMALAGAQLLLGLATVWGTYRLGKMWGLPELAAALAALWIAWDPILLQQSTLVMTETLATALAVWALWRLTDVIAQSHATLGQWLYTGAVLGAAALCRPTFWIWNAMVLVALCLSRTEASGLPQPQRNSERWRGLGAWLLGLAVVTLPWVVRNLNVFDQPIIATTHGGYTLLLGNNPDFYGWLSDPQGPPVWNSSAWEQEFLANWKQAEPGARQDQRYDRLAYRQAWENIRQQPRDFVRSVVYRWGRFWGVTPKPLDLQESPQRRVLRTLTSAWYLALFTLAAIGVWLKGRSLMELPWVFGLLLVLSFALAHAVYWSDLRMRAPIEPVLALLAGLGSARIWPGRAGSNAL
jgi:hypothetical protein